MTNIAKFIEEVWDLRNGEDFKYDHFFDLERNEAGLNETKMNESILVFQSEEELVDLVSTLLAEKHFKENDYLHDRGMNFYKKGNFTELFRMHSERYLRIYTLADIGIKRFCIPSGDRNLIVRYELIPLAERMVIDNFICKCSINKVVDKLSRLSAYEVKTKKKQGFPFSLLTVTCEIKHINSLEQLKMFLYAYKKSQLYLNSDLLNEDLLIEKEYINLSYDDIPKYINFDVFYEGEPWYDDYGDENSGKRLTFNIRFITMLNIDGSLSLKPHPEDIIDAINKTINSLVYEIDIDGAYLFVPPRLKHIFSFLCRNKMESKYGFIEKVLDKNESAKIAQDIDSSYCDYDEYSCLWSEYNPHDVHLSEQVRKHGYIAVETRQ